MTGTQSTSRLRGRACKESFYKQERWFERTIRDGCFSDRPVSRGITLDDGKGHSKSAHSSLQWDTVATGSKPGFRRGAFST